MPHNTEVLVGDANGEHVLVRLLRRAHPQAHDYWDGNWIACEVSVRAGAFRATFTADLRAEEFQRFLGEVRLLQTSLEGVARFETMEEQLTLSLTRSIKGRVQVAGVARDVAGTGNELRFEFDIDQTYLPALSGGLERGLANFPVVGSPDA